MNDLLSIACGSGLQYGLNPCIFMTCAVFMAHGLWLKARSLQMFWLRIIFVSVYALGSLAFNFGPGQVLILQNNFIFAAKIIYLILGLWAFIFGILFFKDWLLINRTVPVNDLPDGNSRSFTVNNFVAWSMTIVLAVMSSALTTFWPVNKYICLLGNEALLKGQWRMALPILISYVFISMWPLWFVWAFLSIKKLQLSLIKIIYAAIFFTASSVIIFVFK